MDNNSYAFQSNNKHEAYEFYSNGPKGSIKKIVLFKQINKELYNLVLGDWDNERQQVNDSINSNNSDRNKVLTTVAYTVLDFISYHPNTYITIIGNTASRTRLYQIAIALNYTQITHIVVVYGLFKEDWEDYEKGKNYEAFLLYGK